MKSTAVEVKYFSCSDILPLLALNSHFETHIIDGFAILKTWLISKIKLPLIMELMRWENVGLGVKMHLQSLTDSSCSSFPSQMFSSFSI